MAFVEGVGDFTRVDAYEFAGASLVTLDAENVLTAYGVPTVRWAAHTAICNMLELSRPPAIAVATNNHDPEYIAGLREDLPDGIPIFSGLEYANKKTSPEMFLAAAEHFDVDPTDAIHVDDQWLSFRGAKLAGFRRGLLVKPFGRNHHAGVKVGRLLDVPIRTSLRTGVAIQDFITDGFDA